MQRLHASQTRESIILVACLFTQPLRARDSHAASIPTAINGASCGSNRRQRPKSRSL
jgi:hypothetical protein